MVSLLSSQSSGSSSSSFSSSSSSSSLSTGVNGWLSFYNSASIRGGGGGGGKFIGGRGGKGEEGGGRGGVSLPHLTFSNNIYYDKNINVSLENVNPAKSYPTSIININKQNSSYSMPGVLSNFVTKNNTGGIPRHNGISGGGGGIHMDEEESTGLISEYTKKSLNFAKNSAAVIALGAKNIANTAHDTFNLNDNNSSSSSSFSFAFNTQRLFYFGAAFAIGCVFMLLAFMLFPTIIFAPSKFALLFTLGSISWVISLGLLRGFKPLLIHLISFQRLPFSVAYVLSLGLTLYSTLFQKSYLLALLFSLVQIFALLFFLVSYIPGGTNALRFIGGAALTLIKNALRCNQRDLSLPI